MAVNRVGTEQQYLVTLSTDTLGLVGNFDKFSGGDLDAKVTLYRPGGMQPLVSYLGLPEPTTVTISRAYSDTGDPVLLAQLRTLVGADYATITVQPLDNNKAPFGTPTTYRGRLTNVKAGTTDSTSNHPRMMEVDVAAESVVN